MMNFIFPDWEYFGPGTDLDKAGKPISNLDRDAMHHDYAYAAAESHGGRRERVEKTKADYNMAFSTDNPFVALGLFTQATVRVFTFNMVDLPW